MSRGCKNTDSRCAKKYKFQNFLKNILSQNIFYDIYRNFWRCCKNTHCRGGIVLWCMDPQNFWKHKFKNYFFIKYIYMTNPHPCLPKVVQQKFIYFFKTKYFFMKLFFGPGQMFWDDAWTFVTPHPHKILEISTWMTRHPESSRSHPQFLAPGMTGRNLRTY